MWMEWENAEIDTELVQENGTSNTVEFLPQDNPTRYADLGV